MSDVLTAADCEVDARGLNCPMPILKAKKGMRDLESGQVMHLVASDSASACDIPVFVQQSGDDLIETFEEDGDYHFFIRKR